MPFFILTILIQVAFVIHVLRTGRNTMWIWIVVMLPLAGSLAYVFIEIVPELMNSRTARSARSNLRRTLDPGRDLRQAQRQLRTTDSIESRRRFADELVAHGQYQEAIEHYRAALTGLFEHDPLLLLGMARAQFALHEFTAARETLDRLIKENPDFRSADGHMLYARALAEEGKLEEAASEFKVLSRSFVGAEAKYRYALVLKQLHQDQQAREMLAALIEDGEIGGKHYRKAQKEWLDLAKRELE